MTSWCGMRVDDSSPGRRTCYRPLPPMMLLDSPSRSIWVRSGPRVLACVLAVPLLLSCRDACFGDESCTVPSPCEGLAFECAGGTASVRTLGPGDDAPTGIDALASTGDVVLSNGRVTAVIDAIDHPHYIAPTGGNLLDLTSADGDDDSLTHILHAVGLLPGDSVAYRSLTTESGDGFAAVEVHGVLAGDDRMRVSTRYEIRPCEPGIRVRTELFHGGAEPQSWAFVDGWYWSGREALPFAPGTGFDQEGLVTPIEDSWQSTPFMAAGAHTEPAATYFTVACDAPALQGFHTEQISGVGRAPRVVPRGGVEVYERFVGVVSGSAIQPAADEAFEIRRQLFDEPYVTLSGRVDASGDPLGDESRAAILVSDETGTVWTQITPALDGSYSARVPAFHTYTLATQAFGREVSEVSVQVTDEDVDVSEIRLPAAAEVALSVLVDGVADHALVFVRPADDATDNAVRAELFGGFFECAPLLGSSTGGSPACDRVLVNGPVSVRFPPGRYEVYASGGPFTTVATETLDLSAGEEVDVELSITRLPLVPDGALGADFHVHGGASFDSTVPDFDRVQAFLASNIDVIATTEHDVVWDYADARRDLGADDRMAIMVGLEATGHILFDLTPGEDIPQVIGHWNVWPLPFDPQGPYRGAPWDELAEPGALFDRFVEAGWPADTGVIQLNHPWSPSQFGRDLGFPRAVGVNANDPLPREFDGTGPSLVLRTPPGAGFSNGAYHTQEVMNGTENEDLLAFRAYWFYLLNQGILRGGTANSDSHGLVDNVLGTPRTLVFTDQTVASFDEASFNADVRAGAMVGTNGPVLEVTVEDGAGTARGPSLTPFAPDDDDLLTLRVSAAPWVPVDEIRIVVNGEVARTLSAELSQPGDPLGTEGTLRFEGEVALREILPEGNRDAWIVVEAGAALPEAGDLNCDGIPDTGDNNGDGTIDWRDVERNDDDVVDAADLDEIDGAPDACDPDQDLGPLPHPNAPGRGEPGALFEAVTPGGYPMSFTNPLLLNRDGGDFEGPGLGGGQ
ncbi:MAG: CehA/McbA family metallohydrolase [Sandaracinaceae bacterium]